MMGNSDGLSLVELLVVVLLISITIGIVIPVIQPQKFQMDGAIVQVASTMTAQQKNSIFRQHSVVVAIDSADGHLRVHYDADDDGLIDPGESSSIVELEDGVVFGRGGAPARPLGSTMNTFVDQQDAMPALTFRPNGSASAESILYLTSSRAAAPGGGVYEHDTRALEIERATGRVRCYSYASGAWLQTC
jgi:type II secretory pathway pseudopilin PulG